LLTVHLCMYCMSTGVGSDSRADDKSNRWGGAAA